LASSAVFVLVLVLVLELELEEERRVALVCCWRRVTVGVKASTLVMVTATEATVATKAMHEEWIFILFSSFVVYI
jgi:hypothetical protein